MANNKSNLRCCVCGAPAGKWQQHWNQDTGYGICRESADKLIEKGCSEEEMRFRYGTEGVNYPPST